MSEKTPIKVEDLSQELGTASETIPYVEEQHANGWARFVDGFRRQEADPSGAVGKQLAKGISQRHLVLMALVTGVGTGLLVGLGKSLHNAGPLFLLIGYAIVGSFLYPTLQAAGELAVNYSELSGGYNNYPRKFLDDLIAFAVTWNYCIQWCLVIAVELVTASLTIKYWNTTINLDAWVAIFYVVIVVINFIGARGFGEGEFVFGSIKIAMIIGFIIMGIVVDAGGGPHKDYIGGRYWHNPGFHTNFKGLCSVFVTGAFSLGQSEFVALLAAEQSNPRAAIPQACKLIFWRVLILFIGLLIIVGLLVPYTLDELMGLGGLQTHASPYVIAAAIHGVKGVPHIINAVILLSVTLVASASLYLALRTLQSLADQGFAPQYFNYIDKQGRPLRALAACATVGLFSFIAAYKKEEDVFNWLLAISGLLQIFTWDVIVVSHVRFRAALRYNNILLDSLGYVALTGVWGSVYAIVWHWLILIAQFWIALFPIKLHKPSAESFFQNYLGAVVLLAFYVAHKLWTRNWRFWIPMSEIDIDADRTIFDEEVLRLEKQEQAERLAAAPWYKKVISFLL
jgi:amino acid transporter